MLLGADGRVRVVDFGLARAAGMLAKAAVPAVAIGGIDETNLREVLRTDFETYALIGAVGNSGDPEKAIARLKKIEKMAKSGTPSAE